MSRSNLFRLVGFLLDFACILAALSLGGIWRTDTAAPPQQGLIQATVHVALFAGIWQLVASRLGLDLVPLRRNRRLALRRVAETWATTWGVGGLLSVSLFQHLHLNVWLVLVVGLVLLAGYRLILSATTLGLANSRPRTLVVGACASARSLSVGDDARETMEILGFVPFPGEEAAEMSHLPRLASSTESLQSLLRDHRVDLALVSPSDRAVTGDVHRVFRNCDEVGLGVQYFPSFLDLEHLRVGLAWTDRRPGLSMSTPPNQSLSQLAKRAIDVVGATAGLLALLPVLVACGILVKLTSKGPVFFRQIRVGKNGETFHCLKFRTMFAGAHAQQEKLRAESTQDGPAFKIPKDPRITSVGRVLRKFSLDELPQLLNVLIGDMSLVGPRPPIPTEVDKYTWWQRRRISVKPGLTCVWQVWGRNKVSFKRWVEMDLYYIDNWSLWLDLKLIAHTVRVVVSGTGM
ncbi:MAG: exopolysaccharide biosynthesis polyprenyl glycosylphosphotransferase [Planctomycetes bacterium]|nr:exopolysaccharide biosynthesis polyprenyl glycosylphosphotransferase [Planctomycetota bacterium]